jgi:hypothetical protein
LACIQLKLNHSIKIELSFSKKTWFSGIDTDYQLSFDKHIKNICRKASKQLSVLNRIGWFFLSKLNKLTIFHSFILSNFNFCPLAWHFCSKANIIKLDKIQITIAHMKNFYI